MTTPRYMHELVREILDRNGLEYNSQNRCIALIALSKELLKMPQSPEVEESIRLTKIELRKAAISWINDTFPSGAP